MLSLLRGCKAVNAVCRAHLNKELGEVAASREAEAAEVARQMEKDAAELLALLKKERGERERDSSAIKDRMENDKRELQASV